MKTKVATITMMLMFAGLTALAQEGAIGSEAELRHALATAKTAADHARIAYYYHQAARSYSQSQVDEEQIADRWQKQYEGWERVPNPYASAKNLAAWYGRQANEALTHGAEQDKLANTQSVSQR